MGPNFSFASFFFLYFFGHVEKYLHFDMEYLQWTILDLGLSEGPHRSYIQI
ncbi:hypothetical protein LguiB_001288 [Lonicera macranthoides]